MPNHVALILDGNRRWARAKGFPTLEGHRRGVDAFFKVAQKARQMGIRVFTAWCFSTENWDRTEHEVNYLMDLFEVTIERQLREALKEEIRIIHIGRKDRIRESLKKKIANAEDKTKHFHKYYGVFALDYGGRDEVIRAANKFIADNPQIPLSLDLFKESLDTRDLPYPDPDLIIRTGGEMRTSGFMSWQSAYSEYIFLPEPLPDLTPALFEECIEEFNRRQRRFGK